MVETCERTDTDNPQPETHGRGGPIDGPRDIMREREQPDLFVPPATDKGTMPNLKFSFSDAHVKLEPGGWTREVTARELPIATDLAGVQMHLNGGDRSGAREMHWHKQAEWQIMLAGSARVTAVDTVGRNMVADVFEGDLWLFPAGVPHSIQAHEGGCEFLLVFDDGNFSEENTFMLTDWLAHTPPEVVARNFGLPAKELDGLPHRELYIFPAPTPGDLATDYIASPGGAIPENLIFRPAEWEPLQVPGGRVQIIDSRNFPASQTIAAAIVEVEPGGLRELHWHPKADEWQYFLVGEARMTVFASTGVSRTFNYSSGDVGYVPQAMGHYVENIGDTPLKFLEMFRSDRFEDVSLTQWLALTPPELVRAHLNLSDDAIAALSKEKQVIVRDRE